MNSQAFWHEKYANHTLDTSQKYLSRGPHAEPGCNIINYIKPESYGAEPLNTATFVQPKWKVQISPDFLFLW